jgi:hypothetical protein
MLRVLMLMYRGLVCLQDQAVESQEAWWRRTCGATRIAAAWQGRQARLRLQHLRATRQTAKLERAASAIQVLCSSLAGRSEAQLVISLMITVLLDTQHKCRQLVREPLLSLVWPAGCCQKVADTAFRVWPSQCTACAWHQTFTRLRRRGSSATAITRGNR